MQLTGITKFHKALKRVRKIQSDFPASALHCLVIVMTNEGVTQLDVSKKLDLPRSTTSRCMRLLSDRLEPGKDGMGLIYFLADPNDTRFKGSYLTPKGKALMEELAEILS
jgi:DNA-binding MarR family transcriptional regulator